MSADRSLEERIDELESEREIRDLLIKYAQRLDARDHAGYARLFAEDGEWKGAMGNAIGPAAIEQMLEDGFGKTPPDFVNIDNFHLMSNFVVEIDGDTATAASRLTYFVRGPDNAPVAKLAGRYNDELVREAGRWLFKYRKVTGDIPTVEEVKRERAKEAAK